MSSRNDVLFLYFRHQRLPGGLKSNFVGLSSLHNMDEDIGFEDVLDSKFCQTRKHDVSLCADSDPPFCVAVPDLRETPSMPMHDAMELKLKL